MLSETSGTLELLKDLEQCLELSLKCIGVQSELVNDGQWGKVGANGRQCRFSEVTMARLAHSGQFGDNDLLSFNNFGNILEPLVGRGTT